MKVSVSEYGTSPARLDAERARPGRPDGRPDALEANRRHQERPGRLSLIPALQLQLLATWLDTEPDVPEEQWFKRFPGMTVCGEGELVKTFLLPRQHPKGKRLR